MQFFGKSERAAQRIRALFRSRNIPEVPAVALILDTAESAESGADSGAQPESEVAA